MTSPGLILFSSLLLTLTAMSQVRKGDTYPVAKVKYDSAYGLVMYEKMNFSLGGDSVRYDKKGYSATGWYEDYYEGGAVLHKGYYAEGALKTYQNFYSNGQVERIFKSDYNKSSMKIYYSDGKMKADIEYSGANVIKEADYYPNGQMEFIEEYNKDGIFIRNNFYNENGKPTSTLELLEPKKLVYEKKEYHDNGNIKEAGKVVYNKGAGDYQREGKWLVYDENGKAVTEVLYSKGEVASERKL
ncbi:MAG: hypothetical protein IT233_12840 [Bacteroidia bacterium]|nr:hypothetical protein [Bacteroidia bacterium]